MDDRGFVFILSHLSASITTANDKNYTKQAFVRIS
jgi:hypothetical protein